MDTTTRLDKYGMVPSKFSRDAFGGDESAAADALAAHEALLVPGTQVRIYRGSHQGSEGTITEILNAPRSWRVTVEVPHTNPIEIAVESSNLEIVFPSRTERKPETTRKIAAIRARVVAAAYRSFIRSGPFGAIDSTRSVHAGGVRHDLAQLAEAIHTVLPAMAGQARCEINWMAPDMDEAVARIRSEQWDAVAEELDPGGDD